MLSPASHSYLIPDLKGNRLTNDGKTIMKGERITRGDFLLMRVSFRRPSSTEMMNLEMTKSLFNFLTIGDY